MLTNKISPVIDANINRVSEGLRVLEEYARFVAHHQLYTDQIAKLRKKVNQTEQNEIGHLASRNVGSDMRAKEVPRVRKDWFALLKANFKRIEEGLRVLEEYSGNSVYNELRYDVYLLEKEMLLTLLKKKIRCPGIYLISDKVDVLKKGLDWGVSLIQLRDKIGTKQDILKKAQQIRAYSKSYDTPFIVNDYMDIAQIVDADGLHTGQDDISVTLQRELLGPHKIIGRTSHDLEQGRLAEKQGADYVSVGPIWKTPSKPGRDAIGFDYLRQAKEALGVPFVAIGGINSDNLREIVQHAAPLIGVIRDYENIPQMMSYLAE